MPLYDVSLPIREGMPTFPGDPQFKIEVEALIEEREQARELKDYQRADDIRNRLQQMGVILEDTPAGTRWKKEKL